MAYLLEAQICDGFVCLLLPPFPFSCWAVVQKKIKWLGGETNAPLSPSLHSFHPHLPFCVTQTLWLPPSHLHLTSLPLPVLFSLWALSLVFTHICMDESKIWKKAVKKKASQRRETTEGHLVILIRIMPLQASQIKVCPGPHNPYIPAQARGWSACKHVTFQMSRQRLPLFLPSSDWRVYSQR